MGYIRRFRWGTFANLEIGSYSQSALLLFSRDVRGGFNYDSNLIFNKQSSEPVRRAQYAQSLAASHPLFEEATAGKRGGVVEFSHFTPPFVELNLSGNSADRSNIRHLLFAAVYSVRPNLVLDAAFGHGLTSTSTQWQGSFGLIYPLPRRLWKDRHPVPIPTSPFRYCNPR